MHMDYYCSQNTRVTDDVTVALIADLRRHRYNHPHLLEQTNIKLACILLTLLNTPEDLFFLNDTCVMCSKQWINIKFESVM